MLPADVPRFMADLVDGRFLNAKLDAGDDEEDSITAFPANDPGAVALAKLLPPSP